MHFGGIGKGRKEKIYVQLRVNVAWLHSIDLMSRKKNYSDKNEMKKWNVWQELIKKELAVFHRIIGNDISFETNRTVPFPVSAGMVLHN